MPTDKHAFLIIAHHEFDILQSLITSLDDNRNDIFIHVDKKVTILPEVYTSLSKVYFVENRIDVCWGDVSVVEAEYELFESAHKNGNYSYYHLISGVDLPLVSQDELHSFFLSNIGKEFIGFSNYNYKLELSRKVNYVHLFPRYFRRDSTIQNIAFRILRALFLRIQMLFFIKRNKHIDFKKGTQWVSVTDEFVKELLLNREKTLEIYRNTYCPDEIYKQTICWNSSFRDSVFCMEDEAKGSMRMIGWKDGVLYDWVNSDYEKLIKSGKLFARKFSSSNQIIINRILDFVSK